MCLLSPSNEAREESRSGVSDAFKGVVVYLNHEKNYGLIEYRLLPPLPTKRRTIIFFAEDLLESVSLRDRVKFEIVAAPNLHKGEKATNIAVLSFEEDYADVRKLR